MSTIIVELRSQFRDILGQDRVVLHFEESDVSVKTIMEKLLAESPGAEKVFEEKKLLAEGLPKGMFVADNRMVRAESRLHDGDTLKIFPHIFGG